MAEEYADDKSKANEFGVDGWTTSRHHAVPTTDIPLHEITKLRGWFVQVWKDRIRPLLRKQFRLGASNNAVCARRSDMFIHDVFVVRYDATGGQRYLPPHRDESTHSFTIALNSDFVGGGTYIHALGKELKPGLGGMLSFCGGELLHSGDPITKGKRYIIVAFCYSDAILAEHGDEQIEHRQLEQKSDLVGMFGEKRPEEGGRCEPLGNVTNYATENKSFSFGFNF